MIHQISIHVISIHGLCLKFITLCHVNSPFASPLFLQKTPWNSWLCSTYVWRKRGTYQRGLLPKFTTFWNYLQTLKSNLHEKNRIFKFSNFAKRIKKLTCWIFDFLQIIELSYFRIFVIKNQKIEKFLTFNKKQAFNFWVLPLWPSKFLLENKRNNDISYVATSNGL